MLSAYSEKAITILTAASRIVAGRIGGDLDRPAVGGLDAASDRKRALDSRAKRAFVVI